MLKDIRHIGIVVKNIEESMLFYRGLLGFEVYDQRNETGGFIDGILQLRNTEVTTYKMKRSGFIGHIELLYFRFPRSKERDRKINDIGVGHIAFTVKDLELEYDRLSNEGIFFLSKPQLSADGKAKVAFCRAPEGTFIELVQVIEGY